MILEISVFLLLLTLLMIQIVRIRRQKDALLVPDWSRDMVYLAQFPPSPNVRSISPFSLKLETWLRLAKIPYKNIYTRKFAKSSHTIPYIELNGVQIADSNTIIATLRKQFSVDVDSNLSPEQVAVSHAVTAMLENHTAQVSATVDTDPMVTTRGEIKQGDYTVLYCIIGLHYNLISIFWFCRLVSGGDMDLK